MSAELPLVTLCATVKGRAVRLIISELMNPSLSKVVGLLYADRGVAQPGAGHWIIPSVCASKLQELEEAASALSTESFAPEDSDAVESIRAGEAVRYVDTEMASFVLSRDSTADAIAARIPHGTKLLELISCVDDYLENRAKHERDLRFRQ